MVDDERRSRWLVRRFGAAPRRDLLAGLTVSAYLVPQVMAYAGVAGVPPVAGLWAAAAALAGYALVGSARQLCIGPESTTALMTAVAVAPLSAARPDRAPVLAAGLAVLVGLVCLVGRVARLGFLADLLSRPVLVGYMAGIAAIMIVSQLSNVTGIAVHGGGIGSELAEVARGVAGVHLPTLVLATAVLAFLLAAQRWLPRLPGPLIAVLVAAGVTSALGPATLGVRTVGTVPTGLPLPALPAVTAGEAVGLMLPAVGVAVVGYADTVLTGRAFVSRHGEHLDADQEMLALGVVNVAAGLFAGFPVSSSGSRTALADAAGARSQLHSVVTLAAVLAVLVVGGPVLAALPSAALGALVIYAAGRLVELGEFRRIARFRRTELLLTAATLVGVIVLGVLPGILVAIGLSILDLLRRVSRPHDGVLGYVPGLAGMHDIDDYPDSTLVPGLVVYRYDAPLCFANAEDFRRRVLDALDRSPTPPRWLLLNTEAMIEIDLTAADMLGELADELDRRGVELALARVKQDLRTDLEPCGLVERIGEHRIFPTLPTAVEAYHAAVGDQRRGEA